MCVVSTRWYRYTRNAPHSSLQLPLTSKAASPTNVPKVPIFCGVMACILAELWRSFDKYIASILILTCKAQGKAIPVQAWTGPDGSRRMRLPDFKEVSLSALGTGRLYPPPQGNISGTHFC